MNKLYKFLFFVLASVSSLTVFSQTYNQFPIPSTSNGTSGNGRAPVTQALFHRNCALYRATEFAGFINNGDTISKLGWNISTAAAAAVTGNITIYMVNTADATYARGTTWATILTTPTAMTSVYSGSMTIPAATGVYEVTLTTPFVYTGGGVYLAFEWAPTATSTAAIYSCNTTLAGGSWNNNNNAAFNATLTANSAFRPQVFFSVPKSKVDLQVKEVYTLGKLPIPYANPHNVRAHVRNLGADTLFNYPIVLDISGANTFLDTLRVDTFLPSSNRNIQFNNFNPSNLGTNVVTVSVPIDSNNTNNTKSFTQIITSGSYSYTQTTLPAAGGVGFTGATGDFVAKFPYTGTNSINQIGVNFNTGGQTLRIGIWDTSATGTPGTLLWQSALFTTTAGINTIAVTPAVPVTGSFFCGVIQSGTTNAAFSFQNEDPIRSGVFYYTSPTGNSTWTDFQTTSSNFRFMIEPRLQVANDIGVSGMSNPCQLVLHGGPILTPQFTVNNYGLNTQTNFILKTEITGPVNYSSADTIVTSLASSTVLPFNSSIAFNPSTNGTYNVKVWTEMVGDLDANNDTATYSFTVFVPSATVSSSNGLQFSGANYIQAIGSRTLNVTGNMLSLEAWVKPDPGVTNRYIISKDSTANIPQYALYIDGSDKLVLKLNTTSGIDSVVSTATVSSFVFNHLAATYDGTEMKVYINGALVGSKLFTGNIIGNIQPVYFCRSGFSAGFLSGTIDEIRIWDTIRSVSDIRNNMHTRFANSPFTSLKGYYRLDEVSGAFIIDVSGNCNVATVNNLPAMLATNIPLANPIVSSVNVTSSGSSTFVSSNVKLTSFNQVGSNDYTIHYFPSTILGTSPITTPGGITQIYNLYWVTYKYGNGSVDSLHLGFPVNMLNPTASLGDFRLFSRLGGESGSWVLEDTTAFEMDTALDMLTFKVDTQLYHQLSIGAINNGLPVRLVQFKGLADDNSSVLIWQTASELNNAYFEIERSTDGKNFVSIGKVNGMGTTQARTNYQYIDYQILTRFNKVFYRLKQVDFNGSYTRSAVVVVYANRPKQAVEMYPNPTNGRIHFTINQSVEKVTVLVYDLTGKTLMEVPFDATYNNSLNVNLNQLNNGVYFVKVISDGTLLHTQKLIKTD